TWQLIANRFHARYLPAGYILDSGAPCAFPRDNVSMDEVYFALGWTLTNQCNKILKEVINHTKNIQGKDFERLPYPFWVSSVDKARITLFVKDLIIKTQSGYSYKHGDEELRALELMFDFPETANYSGVLIPKKLHSLFEVT
ncbi:MAG TPA: hypothetical protein VJI73_01110, partial [Candidatus Paceibacterota bacterium]